MNYPMRILALDYGTVRIGVALSDDLKMIASPRAFLPAEPFPDMVDKLKSLIREHEVELILISLPRNMDGSYGAAAAKVRSFVAALKDVLLVPIRTWDERLTTVSAARQLIAGGTKAKEQRAKLDSAAAMVLLQGYLDSLTLE